MKITTLNDRIEKAEAMIAKKENTIAKKTASIEKKTAKIVALGGDPTKTAFDYRNTNDLYWLFADIEWLKEDIERGLKEIEEKKETLEKYKKQLAGEIEREEIILKEMPEVFIPFRDDLVEKWDRFDIKRRDFLKEEYINLGYTEFIKKYKRAGYEYRFTTDEQIHDNNLYDAKNLILNLYYRVKDITGEITSWSNLYVTSGNAGAVINGFVEGKEGRAEVESIIAGGYNIQRLHIRVLVKDRR